MLIYILGALTVISNFVVIKYKIFFQNFCLWIKYKGPIWKLGLYFLKMTWELFFKGIPMIWIFKNSLFKFIFVFFPIVFSFKFRSASYNFFCFVFSLMFMSIDISFDVVYNVMYLKVLGKLLIFSRNEGISLYKCRKEKTISSIDSIVYI